MAAAPDLRFPEPAESPSLMTIEEYRKLPSRRDAIEELHWGQLVTLSFPMSGHKKIQRQLLNLLQARAGDSGVVDLEVPFRALPEYDIRGADVAFTSRQRYEGTDDNDNLHGSPELVIEILSPSNTSSEMREHAALCLATGAQEFWIVNPTKSTVTVLRRGGSTTDGPDGVIPLPMSASEMPVSLIFK